jgi:hypothetical protein
MMNRLGCGRSHSPLYPLCAVVATLASPYLAAPQAALAADDPVNVVGTEITAPDASQGETFARSVDISGDWAIVGRPNPESDEAVLLYKLVVHSGNVKSWDLQQTIRDPHQQEGQKHDFGWAVAIHDDIAAIGAPNADTDNGGAVYIYARDAQDRWNPVEEIESPFPSTYGIPPYGSGSLFGWSVDARSISFNVFRALWQVAVGAPGADDAATGTAGVGAALVAANLVVLGRENFSWFPPVVEQYLHFGWSVAIGPSLPVFGDDNSYFFGAPGASEDRGLVVEERGSPGSAETHLIQPDDQRLGDEFGIDVDVSEQDRVIVGTLGLRTDGVGNRAFVFQPRMADEERVSEATLTPTDRQDLDFGASVGIDGNLAIVGTPASSIVSLFVRDDAGAWSERGPEADGDRFVDATDAGELEENIGRAPTGPALGDRRDRFPDTAEPGDRFGVATALDGNRFIVGAPLADPPGSGSGYDSGSAYIFEAQFQPPAPTPTDVAIGSTGLVTMEFIRYDAPLNAMLFLRANKSIAVARSGCGLPQSKAAAPPAAFSYASDAGSRANLSSDYVRVIETDYSAPGCRTRLDGAFQAGTRFEAALCVQDRPMSHSFLDLSLLEASTDGSAAISASATDLQLRQGERIWIKGFGNKDNDGLWLVQGVAPSGPLHAQVRKLDGDPAKIADEPVFPDRRPISYFDDLTITGINGNKAVLRSSQPFIPYMNRGELLRLAGFNPEWWVADDPNPSSTRLAIEVSPALVAATGYTPPPTDDQGPKAGSIEVYPRLLELVDCLRIHGPVAGVATPEGVAVTEVYEHEYPGRIYRFDFEDSGDQDFNDLVAMLRVGDDPATPNVIELDADGDGLWDDWERFGVDVNGNGVIEDQLGEREIAELGDPMHKDLYVEFDWMGPCTNDTLGCKDEIAPGHSHDPGADGFQQVIDAFAAAPVSNPDGEDGIALHIDRSQQVPHHDAINFLCDKDGFNSGVDAVDFDAVKRMYFPGFGMTSRAAEARRFTHRYAVLAHAQSVSIDGKTFNTSTGCGEGNGDDFVVTMLKDGSRDRTARTFMHELGHTLGLQHGGADDVNYKPNYLSLMNYRFQLIGLLAERDEGRVDFVSDYSREKLPDLNEKDLSEPTGLGATVSPPGGGHYLTSFFSDGVAYIKFADEAVDWNHDGDTSDVMVMRDINNKDGATETLTGYDDWANLTYAPADTSKFSAGASDPPQSVPDPLDYTPPPIEPELEEVLLPVADAGAVPDGDPFTPNGMPFEPYACLLGGTVRLDGSGSYDPIGTDLVAYAWDYPGGGPADASGPSADYPCDALVGEVEVSLVVTGEGDRMVGDEATIQVSLDAGPDRTVECGSPVTLGSGLPTSPSLGYAWMTLGGVSLGTQPTIEVQTGPGSSLPLGSNLVSLTVVDDRGESVQDQLRVSVADSTAPEIRVLSASRNRLWPPNHKLVPVDLTIGASDVCDPVAASSCAIQRVVSNEPDSGLDPDDVPGDIVILDRDSVLLRAERGAEGAGRAYTVTVGCIDATGNAVERDVLIVVPHDRSGCGLGCELALLLAGLPRLRQKARARARAAARIR